MFCVCIYVFRCLLLAAHSIPHCVLCVAYASEDGLKRLKKVPAGVKMAALNSVAAAVQDKPPIVFKKMSRFDGSLFASVTRPEIKSYFVRKGYHVADVKIDKPIRNVGTHSVMVDDCPVSIRVVGFH